MLVPPKICLAKRHEPLEILLGALTARGRTTPETWAPATSTQLAAMKSSPASVVGILCRLSTGVSRQSVRHGHTTARRKQPRHDLTGFKRGLGEQIWVHHHIAQGMIIYTHKPELPVR